LVGEKLARPFGAYRGGEPYVFVCYAHEDAATVYPELAALNEQGVRIWYDEGISAGRSWREEIGTALLGAERVLFYISPAALASQHCNREINLALDENKEILPIYLTPVELTPDLKIGISRLQALNRADVGYLERLTRTLSTGAPAEAPAVRSAPALRSGRRWTRPAVALAALALAVLAGWYVVRENATSPPAAPAGPAAKPSVSVAPFSTAGADPRLASFAAAVADDVRANLNTALLNVVAGDRDADYEIDGRVRGGPDDVRVSVELSRTADGQVLWSNVLEERPSVLDDLVLERAPFLARMVEQVIGYSRGRSDLIRSGENPAAVDELFAASIEQAEMDYGLGGNPRLAVGHLERVLALEPNSPGALARLAVLYGTRLNATISAAEARPRAHDYVRRFLAAAPDATFVLGMINLHTDLDYAAARANLTHNPGAVPVATLEGQLCLTDFAAGNLPGAIEHCISAADATPGPTTLRDLGMVLMTAGRYTEAIEAFDRSSSTRGPIPDPVTPMLKALAQGLSGDREAESVTLDEALTRYKDSYPALYAAPLAQLGRADEARALLAEGIRRREAGTSVLFDYGPIFLGYACLGDLDPAFAWLDRAIDNREPLIAGTLRLSPLVEPLRADPRFAAAMAHFEAIEADGSLTESVATRGH